MAFWQIYIKGLKIYLPELVKRELDILIDDMKNSKMDIVILIDGKEGTGKSKTGRVIGKYIADKVGSIFTPDNVHFDTFDYMRFSERSKKFTVNVLDESRQALNKRRGMSKSNVMFTNWLSENRDKYQVHIIILPAIHDIDSYISIWRMSLLIHHLKFHAKDKNTESGYKLVRGWFKVFSNNNKLHMVIFNKNKYGYYSYPKQYKIFSKFRDNEVFTEKELKDYEEKKAQKRKAKYSESVSKERMLLSKLLLHLNRNKIMNQKDLGKIIGYTPSGISRLMNTDIEIISPKGGD